MTALTFQHKNHVKTYSFLLAQYFFYTKYPLLIYFQREEKKMTEFESKGIVTGVLNHRRMGDKLKK